MTMLRKRISMGTSASKGSGRIGAMRRSTPTPPANQRTVSIAAVKPENPRDMFYRDEVFDVKVTVTGTQAYKLQLDLSRGEKEQTLGSRGKVQMYDFQNDGILVFPAVPTDTERTKTLKAVINIAQIVKIKVTEVVEDDASNSEPPTSNPEPPVLAETGDIHIVHRLRQYTKTFLNGNVNNYDSYINKWIKYWTDWKIGPDDDPNNKDKYYTFMTDAAPTGDLVKAVLYKESTMKDSTRPDMMMMTGTALNGLTSNHKNVEGDVNASAPEDNMGCSDINVARPPMKYGTPTANTLDDSFKWGIRWLIAKRRNFDHLVAPCNIMGKEISRRRTRDWWGATGAIKRYGDGTLEYPRTVEKLYAEGIYPHTQDKPNTPDYLWPIKVDGSARGNTSETPAQE